MPDARTVHDVAQMLEEKIAELDAERGAARTRVERRPINQRIHSLRELLVWCKTRAGYEPTVADLGLP